MNPFDLKSALLARHAQHVALVHFLIALIVVAVLFDLLSLRKQNIQLLRAAYYTVIVAAISAVPTVATGLRIRQRRERTGIDWFCGAGFSLSLLVMAKLKPSSNQLPQAEAYPLSPRR